MKSRESILQSFLKIGSLSLVFIGLCLTGFIFYISYEDFLILIPKIVEVESDAKALRKPITTEHFFYIRICTVLLIGVGIILFLGRKWIEAILRKSFSFNLELEKEQKMSILAGIFLLINLVFRIFYAIETPIFYDEAWTYLNFTNKGILYSATIYPAPNNHVLHSILTNLSYHLPFSETLNLRLPSIFLGTLSVFFLFVVFGKLFNKKAALILIIIYTSLTPVLMYNFMARGYSFILFFFILGFYAASQIIQKYKQTDLIKYYVLLSISGILGVFTMPSFLYPFFSLNSFLLFFLIN